VIGLSDVGKKIKDMYNRLDTIPACDGQTDGRTDILPWHSQRYAYASRGKTRNFRPISLCLGNGTRQGHSWNDNRNSYAVYRIVLFSMTLSDL